MIEIYHNPRCKKSRDGLQYLRTKSMSIHIIEYLKDGIDESTIKRLLGLLGVAPIDLIRTQEEYYKTKLKGKDISDDKLILEIVKNPKLLKRPIVVHGDKAVLAQPPELIDDIF
ncbi:MAG: arsenate reductase (glutaredoxin) [Bacteroidales bacterium]|nr:arsenate reductase (glutaredoxin) [Bacteroidales bacterium]